MISKKLGLAKGQHLDEVLPNGRIPTNIILDKTICGCGATHSEIESKRDTIMIVPNVPVIEGKMKKHPNLLGVYEGVTSNDVIAYLQNKAIKHKKIMTTPESFTKVKTAMKKLKINMRNTYFMLFDECEKLIQDVDYRGDIKLPMNDFFRFKSKAMVSATPILPSDPRFAKQGFKIWKVAPKYDYKKNLRLVLINNTVYYIRTLIMMAARLNKKLCIFMNSTDTIIGIIQLLKLEDRTKVFCGQDSVKKLKKEYGFRQASINLSELAPITFFTSRFYSAVDIDLEEQPIVVVLTDVFQATQSMVDPQTEVVQAVGRFRNGTHAIFHVTNFDAELTWMKPDEFWKYLKGQEQIYKNIKSMEADDMITGGILKE